MTEKRLLIIAHAPSPNTVRLRDAVAAGARDEENRVQMHRLRSFRLFRRNILRPEIRWLDTRGRKPAYPP